MRDLDPDQEFDDQKFKKISIHLSLGLQKDVQATGEVFGRQKKTSSTSEYDIYKKNIL